MQSSHQYSVEWGLAVFAVIGVMILVLKWAYSERRDSLLSRPPKTGAEHEYGLMAPLAAPKDTREGDEICRMLQRASIRAALVETRQGLRVMVWPEDLSRARNLLLGFDSNDPPA